nr:hypothetical protein CFP56_79163 [Quercus suber]
MIKADHFHDLVPTVKTARSPGVLISTSKHHTLQQATYLSRGCMHASDGDRQILTLFPHHTQLVSSRTSHATKQPAICATNRAPQWGRYRINRRSKRAELALKL